MREQKECKYHGLVEHAMRGNKPWRRWRCLQCERSRVIEWRRRSKLKSIEYKGGSCQICGYNKCVRAMKFHHIDPNEKEFGLSVSGSTRSWERVKRELDKCILLCGNCHDEVHAGITNLPQTS